MGIWGDFGRGEEEVIQRIYTVVIYTVHKIIGKKAASSLFDLTSHFSSTVTAPSLTPYKTGATKGGVAWGTVCACVCV